MPDKEHSPASGPETTRANPDGSVQIRPCRCGEAWCEWYWSKERSEWTRAVNLRK